MVSVDRSHVKSNTLLASKIDSALTCYRAKLGGECIGNSFPSFVYMPSRTLTQGRDSPSPVVSVDELHITNKGLLASNTNSALACYCAELNGAHICNILPSFAFKAGSTMCQAQGRDSPSQMVSAGELHMKNT